MKPRHNKPAPSIPPEELAWLREIKRQLAYDEYMQARREYWLWERPPKRRTEEWMDCPDHPPAW